MSEAATATLKDTTVASAATTTTDTAAAASTTAATTTTPVEVADKDAAELGKLLLDSGVTKDQVNDVLQAPQALAAIRYMVENDPQEFIRSLERTNPGAGENFLDKLSKLYVDRYSKGDSTSGGATGKDAPNAELLAKIGELSEKVNGFQTAAQQAANASAQAQVQARYNARVDDLFSQLPADKVPLTNYEKELIKGKLSNDLASDSNAVKRVYNGNFVDVPTRFKSIVEGLVQDRVAAVTAASKARERSVSSAFPEISGGPVELPKDFYDVTGVKTEDLWDEGPLVRILEQGR
jgi:hypothetical protein